MIIAIDGNEANVKNRVGIGEYAYQLLLQLVKLANLNIMFEVYLKDNPISDMPKESPYWRYKKVGPKKLWTQIGLPIALFSQKKRPDVFFTPSHYAPRFSPVPTAIAVMDLSYIHFPQLFKKRDLYQLVRWTRYSIKHASRVFTISNASKNDIIKYYKIPDERVVVTYPGIKQEKTKSMSGTLKKFGISDKYILFVGTLQPRKNVSRLIEAFSQISPKQKDMQLVLVGKKGWLFEDILSSPQKFGVSDKVVFLDFVSNEDLPALYA
ncbi:MAG: glycosyltransferase family 4 protein, partial [Candidatus Levyibacteriota bacterium]